MMIKLGPQPTQPKGINDLLTLIQFLSDQKSFEVHLERLQKYTKEANKASSTIGKASKIDELHQSALEKEQEATSKLNDLKANTSKLIREAEIEAEVVRASAKRDAQTTLSSARDIEIRAVQREKELEQTRKTQESTALEQANTNKAQQKREENLLEREKEISRKEQIFSQLNVKS